MMDQRSFIAPLDELNLQDEDDLAALALALDEVATLLAAHPRLAGLPDLESEPLESLIARAAAAVEQADEASGWVKTVVKLAEIAHGSRYDTWGHTDLVRARQLQKEVLKILSELEELMV